MSQVYVPGPCELHAGIGSSGALVFVGWTESGVHINQDGAWDDVPADLAGTRVPFDSQQMLEQAFITGDLKVWDNAVFQKLTARSNPRTGTPGFSPPGSVGTLMLAEGVAYRLLVYSPYVVLKPAMAGFRHYNFLTAWLVNNRVPISTKAAKIPFLFRSIPSYNFATGDFNLYNNDATGKPAPA